MSTDAASGDARTEALALLRIQAHANRLANARLHAAMAALPAADWDAPRTGFFPSLGATLNHILGVDLYYIAALHGDAQADRQWTLFQPATSLAELAPRQAASDERLIAWLAAADTAMLAGVVAMPRRAGRIQRDRAAHVLQHLLMHQTHHRGQAHAMLSSTAVVPPQLDEFLMPSEGHLREPDMAALGWAEPAVYGRPPAAGSGDP